MTTTNLPAARIHGISTRVSVATSGPAIGELWQRAGAAGLLAGPEAMAVYHDYGEGQEGLECTVTIGTEAPGEGLDTVDVPAQSCVRFDTDGTIEQVVGVWQGVWKDWPAGGPRAFQADVERWTNGPNGPTAASIYIGTRG